MNLKHMRKEMNDYFELPRGKRRRKLYASLRRLNRAANRARTKRGLNVVAYTGVDLIFRAEFWAHMITLEFYGQTRNGYSQPFTVSELIDL